MPPSTTSRVLEFGKHIPICTNSLAECLFLSYAYQILSVAREFLDHFRVVVLKPDRLAPRRHLVMSGYIFGCPNVVVKLCYYWHLLSIGQNYCQISHNIWNSFPQQRFRLPQMPVVLRLRYPALYKLVTFLVFCKSYYTFNSKQCEFHSSCHRFQLILRHSLCF